MRARANFGLMLASMAAAALGSVSSFHREVPALMPLMPTPKGPAPRQALRRRTSSHMPHQGEGEIARRRRQHVEGRLRAENGWRG